MLRSQPALAGVLDLGEMSLPVEAVAEWRRASGSTEFLIGGVVLNSIESALAAEHGGADYIFFGPVFPTPSKAAYGAPQGIERLREVRAAVKIPVLAIGGITLENTALCFQAGAAGIAAIRLFQVSPDAACRLARDVALTLRLSFCEKSRNRMRLWNFPSADKRALNTCIKRPGRRVPHAFGRSRSRISECWHESHPERAETFPFSRLANMPRRRGW